MNASQQLEFDKSNVPAAAREAMADWVGDDDVVAVLPLDKGYCYAAVCRDKVDRYSLITAFALGKEWAVSADVSGTKDVNSVFAALQRRMS